MAQQNLTIARTESRRGYTIIWTEEGTALVYDMKGNANQTTREYCSCGKEPCAHQRAAFDLDEDHVIPHQRLQEPRRDEFQAGHVVREVFPERAPHTMSLNQAIVVYQAASVALFFLRGTKRILNLVSTKTVTSGTLH